MSRMSPSRKLTLLSLLSLTATSCYGQAQRARLAPTMAEAQDANHRAPLVVRYQPQLRDRRLHLKTIVTRLDGQESSRFEGLAKPGKHRVDVEATFSKDSFLAFGQEDTTPFASWAQTFTVDVGEPRQIVVVLAVSEQENVDDRERLRATASLDLQEEERSLDASLPAYPPLRFRDQPEPMLPESLLRLRVDIWNLVKLCLDESGAVESQTLLRASHPLYDGSLLDAVSRWKAEPFVWEGKPRRVCTQQRYDLRHEQAAEL